MIKSASYIGDGVYACYDGYHVWIWTSNGFRESEKIALEEETMQSLIDYFKRCLAGNVSITEVER